MIKLHKGPCTESNVILLSVLSPTVSLLSLSHPSVLQGRHCQDDAAHEGGPGPPAGPSPQVGQPFLAKRGPPPIPQLVWKVPCGHQLSFPGGQCGVRTGRRQGEAAQNHHSKSEREREGKNNKPRNTVV